MSFASSPLAMQALSLWRNARTARVATNAGDRIEAARRVEAIARVGAADSLRQCAATTRLSLSSPARAGV